MRRPLLRNPRTNLQDEPVMSLVTLRDRMRIESEATDTAYYAQMEKDMQAVKTAQTRGKHRNYTPEEREYVRAEHAKGTPYTEIAAVIGRSHGSVQKQVEGLGLARKGNQGRYKRKPGTATC